MRDAAMHSRGFHLTAAETKQLVLSSGLMAQATADDSAMLAGPVGV